VYVANDWPTALLLLRLQYSIRAAAVSPASGNSSSGSFSGKPGLQQLLVQRLGASAASAYCIHNLAYQGLLSAEAFPRLGLPLTALPALCTSDSWQQVLQQLGEACGGSSLLAGAGCSDAESSPQVEGQQAAGDVAIAIGAGQPGPQPSGAAPAAAAAAEPEAGSCSSGQLNQMRSALLTADCLVTVSPGYAAEVQQEGPFGCGLHDILAARGIRCALQRPLPSCRSGPLRAGPSPSPPPPLPCLWHPHAWQPANGNGRKANTCALTNCLPVGLFLLACPGLQRHHERH
jgi:hypothetical protein